MKIKNTYILLLALFLSSCGGSNSQSDDTQSTSVENTPIVQTQTLTDEELAEQLREAMDNAGGLVNKVDRPIEPDRVIDSSTITGVDSNNNGTRDLIEIIAFQALNMIGGIEVGMYDETVAVMNMLQPQDPPIPNSINQIDVYCAFNELPAGVKRDLSFGLMKTVVLDTQARKVAYRASLEPSSVSLGEDECL